MKKYKGIIFDLNGVLLWDDRWHEVGWREVAKEVRGRPLSAQEYGRIKGRTNKEIFSYLLDREISDQELPGLVLKKEGKYRKSVAGQSDFTLSPHAEELLDFLVARNIPRTIATNSEGTNVAFFVKYFHFEKWFDVKKIVHDDGSLPGKPSPEIYLRAAHLIGLAPADCIVVEDSRTGIQAAHAAGIGKIVALGPQERHAILSEIPGVTEVIADLGEFDRADLD